MKLILVALGLALSAQAVPISDDLYYEQVHQEHLAKVKKLQEESSKNINFNLPAVKYSPPQMIQSQGYVSETHTVQTSDGYLLGLHRVPAARFKHPDGRRKQPVLLQHGLEGCSTNYIDNLYYQSLAYILADHGYDVWVGNVRGNAYSRRHVSLSPKDSKFWEFTWDDMADKDLPAMVDYILQHTGYDQIYYAGHSQGTAMGFAQFSQDPELAKKIKTFFALAPVGRVTHVSGSLPKIAPLTNELQFLFSLIGYNDFLSDNGLVKFLRDLFCGHSNSVEDVICGNIVYLLVGDSASDNQNVTRLGVYLAHNPSGTSTRDVVHWGQMVNAKKFQKYDYGHDGNKEHYRSSHPPEYPVQNLHVPTVLLSGGKDGTADPADIAWLRSVVPKGTIIGDYYFADYTHTDFIWSKTAYKDVYPFILQHMKDSE